MIRFFPLIAITIALISSGSAKAECNPSKVWVDFEKEYSHWRDHRKNKKHRHHGRRGHCGKKHHHRHHHGRRPPPELPPICIICPQPAPPTPVAKPKPVQIDKGFCRIENSEYRSKPFDLGGKQHALSLVVLDNEVAVELVRFNKTSNVSDDDKYFASPEGFAAPAESSQTPLASFPEKAQLESQKQTCNNTRSIIWGINEGKVFPNFFGGRIDMVYTKDMIYTQTSLSTDLSTTAFMDIQLKRVPDKTYSSKK